MITKEKKKVVLQDLTDRFAKSKSMVFIGFQGLGVKDNQKLRRQFRAEGIEYTVAKKTLIKKGLEGNKIGGTENFAPEGPIAVAVGYDDEIAPARIAKAFGKTNDKVLILGGVMNSEFIGAEAMKQIASLPGKDQLRAQLLATMQAPVTGFVNVLAGNMRGLMNVLNAVAEKKK